MVRPADGIGVIVTVEGFRWLDWDGATDWWGRVRNVWVSSLGGWDALRAWCLAEWGTNPLVVVREFEDGGVIAFFCETTEAISWVRECPDSDLPQYGPPWVQLMRTWESLYFSFEEGSDSPERKAFVLACLREKGPFRILFDP